MTKNTCWTVTVILLVLLLGQPAKSSAQRRSVGGFLPYSSFTLGGGSSTYFGDLAEYSHPIKSLTTLPRWNLGLGYTRQLMPRFGVRAMFSWVRIVGDDYTYSQHNPTQFAAQYVRNLHFRNDIKELAFTGIYNFIADGRTPDRRARFTPYLIGGLALIAHNPEAQTPTTTNGNNGQSDARQWVKLQPLHTEGQGQAGYDKPYSLLTVAVPVGFGMRYRLTEDLNLGFEIGFRYTFTDYLDDDGGTYAKPDALQGLSALMADRRFEYDAARANTNRYAIAQQLFQSDPSLFTTEVRGDRGFFKDSYLLTTLSIQYVLPIPVRCPPLK